ncbi:hypothetical protein H4R34_001253 [Dimargaris verticillata]|uniref:Enoyl reductase (ER) domain-containing protein n=1 Tax=Dimargaris verticillata TaxID=2761393 RepID=A0A9W8B540_9FUNG|nr:hypothetical protein H4R34_001253 [Dimargaris verticillata]
MATATNTNTKVVLNQYVPYGRISSDVFTVQTASPAPSEADLSEHDILIAPQYLSVDPYMRSRLASPEHEHVPAFIKGDAVNGPGVAKVLASKNPMFATGDMISGFDIPWAQFSVLSVVPGSHMDHMVQKIQGPLASVPMDWHMGAIGLGSFTGWYGLTEVGKPKPGETVVISSATGSVGQMVVQKAKALGLKVVAVAGSDEKVQYLKNTLKVDAAFNYKTVSSYAEALSEACPKGVDIYYDNVGGEFLDAVLAHTNKFGRVVACGAISGYQAEKGKLYGIKNYHQIITSQITIQGFFISDYYPTHYEAFVRDLSTLVKEGKFVYKLAVTYGLHNGPQAVIDMLEGRNFGKAVIKVAEL